MTRRAFREGVLVSQRSGLASPFPLLPGDCEKREAGGETFGCSGNAVGLESCTREMSRQRDST